MVAKRATLSQLRNLGFHARIFGRGEVKELNKILRPGESIIECAHGYYQGGSGLLVLTDARVLLVDRRPFFLNVEEMSYDELSKSEVDTSILNATLFVSLRNKKLVFQSFSDARLKRINFYLNEMIEKSPAEVSTRQPLFTRPYLDPAWRPHHNTIVNRPRLTKYNTVK